MSRARLCLYVFCRRSLFEQCYELQPTFRQLLDRPDRLPLNRTEDGPYTERHVSDPGPIHLVSGAEEMAEVVNYMMHQGNLDLLSDDQIPKVVRQRNSRSLLIYLWFTLVFSSDPTRVLPFIHDYHMNMMFFKCISGHKSSDVPEPSFLNIPSTNQSMDMSIKSSTS